MRCGRVSPISSRSSFEKLATLFEGSGTSCAERAYCKALDKLTAILVKDGVLHAVHLERKSVTKKKNSRHRHLPRSSRWRMGRNIF